VDWSFLLGEITGERPNYKPEAVGKGWVEPGTDDFVAWDVTALAKAWLQLGVEKGYIQGANDGGSNVAGDQGGGNPASKPTEGRKLWTNSLDVDYHPHTDLREVRFDPFSSSLRQCNRHLTLEESGQKRHCCVAPLSYFLPPPHLEVFPHHDYLFRMHTAPSRTELYRMAMLACANTFLFCPACRQALRSYPQPN